MAAGQRAGRGGSTRTWGETLYSQPLCVSAPYTPWNDKLVGLAFHFVVVWAGGAPGMLLCLDPPSPSLSGGPARQEEGRWVRAGQCQPCPHRVGPPPPCTFSRCPAEPRRWLASLGSTRCRVLPGSPPATASLRGRGTGSRGVHASPACLLGFFIWAGWASGLFLGGPSPLS